MKQNNKNLNRIPGNIGCAFRDNIEEHIHNHTLLKGDYMEWILEPLDVICHPEDYVLDAFEEITHWDSIYKLYFHKKKRLKALYTI